MLLLLLAAATLVVVARLVFGLALRLRSRLRTRLGLRRRRRRRLNLGLRTRLLHDLRLRLRRLCLGLALASTVALLLASFVTALGLLISAPPIAWWLLRLRLLHLRLNNLRWLRLHHGLRLALRLVATVHAAIIAIIPI